MKSLDAGLAPLFAVQHCNISTEPLPLTRAPYMTEATAERLFWVDMFHLDTLLSEQDKTPKATMSPHIHAFHYRTHTMFPLVSAYQP